MNLSAVALLIFISSVVICDTTVPSLLHNITFVDHINKQQQIWKAGINPRFINVTQSQAARLLGLQERLRSTSTRSVQTERLRAATTLPAAYDSRQVYANCVMPIRDQQACGGCWAFASSSMFGMLYCIATNGAVKVDMAPQYPISCDTNDGGCGGGSLSGPWSFFQTDGTMAEADYSYSSGKTGSNGVCSPTNSNAIKYYSSTYSRLSSVAAMQQAIYTYGAIQVGFDVYQDFYYYTSGVYIRTSNSYQGGHSVYLVGWNTDSNGVPYWIAINSWSSQWGMNGVFFIQRGVNMCNMETGYAPISGIVRVNASPATTTTTAKPTTTTTATPTTTTTTTTTTAKPTTTTTTTAKPTTTTTTTTAMPTTTTTTTTTAKPTTTTTTTTTAKPTTTTAAPTRNCWTCSPGYAHWYDLGLPQPSDPCACVATSAPTTTAKPGTPTTTATPTRNCWTCSAGYAHWYDLGLPQPSDPCACVAVSSQTTTSKPATVTTTAAPAATHNCWTCAPGWSHWYDIGLSVPTNGDQCQCIQTSKRKYH